MDPPVARAVGVADDQLPGDVGRVDPVRPGELGAVGVHRVGRLCVLRFEVPIAKHRDDAVLAADRVVRHEPLFEPRRTVAGQVERLAVVRHLVFAVLVVLVPVFVTVLLAVRALVVAVAPETAGEGDGGGDATVAQEPSSGGLVAGHIYQSMDQAS
ncbi:hypothetical protein BRD08_01475 [Halobacteriales archaeon SW_10_66_29]|nr:MAG: hypothetical protein BRD08_01475 [Halobacteriales archaeon SW_10_66_29]